MERRHFLQHSAILSAAALLAPLLTQATGKKNPVIMIVSGWQDVNIGDITHTPGLIGLLKQRLPNASLILWKKSDSQRVDDLLKKNYPALRIVHGQLGKDLIPESDEVKLAFKEADLFIHGSGPAVVAADHLRSWLKLTNKPFGIFGVTIQDSIKEIPADLKELLQKASFIFTRETASVEVLRKSGLQGSHISFAPDATFVLEIHDEKKATTFLKENNLTPREFICVVPRLRYTPYWEFAYHKGWTEERIKMASDTNEKYKEVDHAKLREAMITWVRKTGHKVLVCPEMTYQLDIMDELLINPLPEDVKPFVQKRGYWMPDEAASIYAKAYAVLSCECHSPIIAAANGTPAFYLRQPTDTIKGQMYYDLGFNDWVFEIDNVTGEQIAGTLMKVHNNYPAALQKVKQGIKNVNQRYDIAFAILKKQCEIFA